MANENRATFIGRLTKDPDFNQISDDVCVANLSIATSKKYKNSNGETQEETLFIDLVCWNKLALNAREFLIKGQSIYCTGHLETDQWESTKKCPNCGLKEKINKQKHRLGVDKLQFLGNLRKDGEEVKNKYQANLNRVEVIGRLVKDPELKIFQSGHKVASFSVATTRKYKNRKNESKEQVCYIDIVAWNRTAENAMKVLKKGQEVFVDGRLELQKWTPDKNCEKCGRKETYSRQKHRLILDNFLCTGPQKKSS